jgi:hypothetical protein
MKKDVHLNNAIPHYERGRFGACTGDWAMSFFGDETPETGRRSRFLCPTRKRQV